MNALPPPTLRDVALRAGVSHTTVSLSLRNDPRIPSATRGRIRKIARAMGYRGNLQLSAHMTRVQLRHALAAPEVVAFLSGGPEADTWRGLYAQRNFFEGARKRGEQLGIRLEAFWLGENGSRAMHTCNVLVARGIRAVLLAPFPRPFYAITFDWKKFVCVALGFSYIGMPFNRVQHRHFSGAYAAFENLERLGYRRIGFVLDEDENRRSDRSWLAGYLSAQHLIGGHKVAPLITKSHQNHATLREWLERETPDAIIGVHPELLAGLKALGRRVPRDIAFASLDVHLFDPVKVQRTAGIDQRQATVGSLAMDHLVGQMYRNEYGFQSAPVFIMIDGRWVNGRSAPARRP
jgi:LacI family transcriptional regulator